MARSPALRSRAGLLAMAGLLACVLAAALYGLLNARRADFGVFHVAAQRAALAEPLYRVEDGDMPFKYAPLVAELISPLGRLPFQLAKALWFAVTALALWRFFGLIAAMTASRLGPRAVAVLVTVTSPFWVQVFVLGQVDAMLLCGMALSERWSEDRPVRSGALWALACLVKPPFLVFAAPALLGGQWRRLVTLALALGGGLLLPALHVGWATNLYQLQAWQRLLAATTPPMLCARNNQSAFALACASGAAPGSTLHVLVALGLGALACAAFAFVWVRLRSRGERALARAYAFGVCTYLTAFLSPLGWWANLLAISPLAGLMLGRGRERGRRMSGALVVVAIGALGALVPVSPGLAGTEVLHALLAARVHGLVALGCALLTSLALAIEPGLKSER